MELIKNYRDNETLRKSFHALAMKTYGLDFEDWYENGYWGEAYTPYSIVEAGRIVANVSVNTTDFILDGSRKHFIQLGTVMTDEAYRKRGYGRRLMEEVEKDYAGKTDGIYLFANDSVLDFYPRFGFKRAFEYGYEKAITADGKRSIHRIPMHEKRVWDGFAKIVEQSVPCGRFAMAGNSGLVLFYVTKFMQDNVYYSKAHRAYLIAEEAGETLLVHGIFAEALVEPSDIAKTFGQNIKKVRLGFTPFDTAGYTLREVKEEDTTLFVKGEGFDFWAADKLMFPTLAHA